MQATFYVPDEVERLHRDQKGLREPCTLQSHHDFAAEAMGEKQNLTTPAAKRGLAIANSLVEHTKKRSGVFAIWGVEALWLILVLLVVSMEMWGNCPFEMGIEFVCRYCYSTSFLVWNVVMLAMWVLNLFLYVLLVSRGFSFKFQKLGRTVSKNVARGVPEAAVRSFAGLCIAMLIWIVVGVFVLYKSGSCISGGWVFGMHSSAEGVQKRSPLVFGVTIINVVVAPFLLSAGRFADFKSDWVC